MMTLATLKPKICIIQYIRVYVHGKVACRVFSFFLITALNGQGCLKIEKENADSTTITLSL